MQFGESQPSAVIKLYADGQASVTIAVMPRIVQIPDIRKVDLPEARQAIPRLHGYLRECILDGH